jgi:hypothetical protein
MEKLGRLVHRKVLENLLAGTKGKLRALHINSNARALSIPLELAEDGDFLFQKNALAFCGRDDRQGGKSVDQIKLRRVLIIADPTRRFPLAYEEGCALYELFESAGLEVDLLSRPLDRERANRIMRGYDVVHFAGHAGGDPAGWDMGSGTLQFVGEAAATVPREHFPALIFSSCCGNTIPLGLDFLRAGAVNVVASRWQHPDRNMHFFLREMYRRLLFGQEVGCAFHRAQVSCFRRNPLCALFLLMGESRVVYAKQHS